MKNLSQTKQIMLIIPSLGRGGAERVISILANQWAQEEHLKVTLLLLTKKRKYYDIDSRVNIVEPYKDYKGNFISKSLYSFWLIRFIRSKINQIKPNSTLSFCERYNNIVLLSMMGTKFKIFVSDRNNPSNNLGLIHETLRKYLYKNVDGIIAQTKKGKEVLFHKTKNTNISCIYNPLRNIANFDVDREKIILNVGRYENQKNQMELIEIFASLKNSEEWKLYIIGNGSLEEALLDKIQQHKLENKVILLKFQANIDLYFQRASIFAFPSLYEGFPNALSEAMANELPCVTYDCPTGPGEMITDSVNGYLVPLKNKQHFLNRLQLLVDDETLRNSIGKEAAKKKEKLSTEKICNDYLNTILEK